MDSQTDTKGQSAYSELTMGTDLISNLIKSTLGPHGKMKLLVSPSSLKITNDGSTILQNLQIDSPSARVLADLSRSQDWEEGDGTTSVVILASALIREGAKQKISRTALLNGYTKALEKCLTVLDSLKFRPSEKDLLNLAKTTLNSKVLKGEKFAQICVEATKRTDDLEMINIIKVPGKIEDSFLAEGFILDRQVKVDKIKNPKILIANTAMDADKIKINSAKVQVNSIAELAEIERAERRRMEEKVERVCRNGIQVFVNRQLIYDYPMQLLKTRGVVPIEHADFEGVERLARFLGGRIVSEFDATENCEGTCEEISNCWVGDRLLVHFKGSGRAVTIVLCGPSEEWLDEAERSIHDALCVLRQHNMVVYGGGAPEAEMASFLHYIVGKTESRDSIAMEAFANALLEIPMILAENAGLDVSDAKSRLRSMHGRGKKSFGIGEDVECMKERGVVESHRIKKRILCAAVEAAQMILKCDGLIRCKPRERTRV